MNATGGHVCGKGRWEGGAQGLEAEEGRGVGGLIPKWELGEKRRMKRQSNQDATRWHRGG